MIFPDFPIVFYVFNHFSFNGDNTEMNDAFCYPTTFSSEVSSVISFSLQNKRNIESNAYLL